MRPEKLALAKLLLTQYFFWYSVIANGPMMAAVFILSFQDRFLFGHRLSSWHGLVIWAILAVLGAIWTYAWFKRVYPSELQLSSRLNPEWQKLMQEIKK